MKALEIFDKKFNKSILSPYHNIRYIYNDKNIGVAGAKAVFEVKAKGKYIMMLDSDTLIDKNMLGELVKENISALTIHLRTTKELSLVPANWDHIKRIKEIIS